MVVVELRPPPLPLLPPGVQPGSATMATAIAAIASAERFRVVFTMSTSGVTTRAAVGGMNCAVHSYDACGPVEG